MDKLIEAYCDNWSEDSFSLVNTASRLALNILFYVQSIGYFKTMPPYFTERTNLPSFLLIYTLKGEGRLQLENGVLSLKPNTCAWINCMEHHRYETTSSDGWEFLYLHFYGSNSMGYYQEFVQSGTNTVQIPNSEHFSAIFWNIIRLQKEKPESEELRTNQQIVALLTDLLSACKHDHGPAATYPPYLQSILHELDTSYGSSVSLEQLAEKHNISKYHLSREFKRLTGINFTTYLTRLRLNYAKQLLSFTDIPISEIALQCGFSDGSHFNRVFKEHEGGKTPLSYRKQWR